MKVDIVLTVLNEIHTIESVLNSLSKQTKVANTVIIVDAGSDDGTYEFLTVFKKDSKLDILLLCEVGANRSQARNIGIQASQADFVAVTDAGCICDPQWLEALSRRFEEGCDVVAGVYRPQHTNGLAALLYKYLAPSSFGEDFLPSSRSIGFSKKSFQAVGGYPEYLNTCEDLVFAQNLADSHAVCVERNAFVLWDNPTTLWEFSHKLGDYARGDVQALYLRHVVKILSVFLRYVVFLVFPGLFWLYLLWPLVKFGRHVPVQTSYLLPVVQVVADMSVMYGALKGLSWHLGLKKS